MKNYPKNIIGILKKVVRCKVEFSDLPEANQKVMINLAGRLIAEWINTNDALHAKSEEVKR